MEKNPFRNLIYQFKLLVDEALRIEAEAEIEEEKSCMTSQDCEKCIEPCNLYGSPIYGEGKIIPTPEALDLEEVKIKIPSKETLDATKRSKLCNKYSKRCSVCDLIAVHDHSRSGVCPDCAADLRRNKKEETDAKTT